MSVLNVRLPEDLESLLEQEAEHEHRSRSDIAREALRWYLRKVRRERLLGELDADARLLADEDPRLAQAEFQEAEAETLRKAEHPRRGAS